MSSFFVLVHILFSFLTPFLSKGFLTCALNCPGCTFLHFIFSVMEPYSALTKLGQQVANWLTGYFNNVEKQASNLDLKECYLQACYKLHIRVFKLELESKQPNNHHKFP